MRFRLNHLFALRYLRGASDRSMVKTMALISVIGVTVGVMALIVVLSVMGGFDDAIRDRLLSVQPHLVVNEAGPQTRDLVKSLTPAGTRVETFSKQDVLLRTLDGSYYGGVAYGVEEAAFAQFGARVRRRVEYVEGASGSATQSKTEKESLDFRLQPDEVAVGSELALTLGVVEGDEINVVAPESLLMPTGELPVFERVKVRAVIRTNIPENDATLVVFDSARGLKRLRDSAGVERGLEVRLNNPFEAESLLHKLTGLGVGGVQTWSDRNKALFYSLGMEKRLMTFFLILTVIIASFSVVTVLFLLVTEKRPDVGALRAMGATQAQVRSIFTFVGLALGSLGICLGGVLGLGLSWWAKTHQIIELPDYYYDRTIPVRIELLTVLVILGGCLVLAWLGSMIPAARVARLDPVKALRRN